MQDNIKKLAYLVIGLFIILIFYLSYIQVYQGEDLAANPKNRRLIQKEEEIVRGTIYDKNGVVLATSQAPGSGNKRVYPNGSLVGGFVGYSSRKYGKTGLEDSYNKYLLGLTEERYWSNFKDRLLGKPRYGEDLYLSLDIQLQTLAEQLMGNQKGAVVALNPKTGEVLALYSNPGFDPNKIDEIWEVVNKEGANSPLINRATQGLYPPGSTMKVVTGTLALKSDPALLTKTFPAKGYIDIDGFRLTDHADYGQLGFLDALKLSSNAVFARLGLNIGSENFYRGAQEFGFESPIPFDIPVATSTLAKPNQRTKTELGSSAIGQGKVLATPLQMALVASAIANEGKLMAPRLVTQIKSHDGQLIKKMEASIFATPCQPEVARIMSQAMTAVVDSGTGTTAQIPGVKVAGKTGTAENPKGKPHAWFMGFAPANNPQIAVAVIVENAGYGGTEAAPIAKAIIEKALK